MDYNNQNNYRPPQFYPNPGTTFAMISMILGIGSVFTLMTIYLPIILGSLSIIFAVLSSGTGKKLLATAKVGIGSAVGSIAVVIALMGSVFGLILGSSRENLIQLYQQMDQIIESQMGASPEELIGESYENVMRSFADTMGK